jgi:hypothetical protein
MKSCSVTTRAEFIAVFRGIKYITKDVVAQEGGALE